MGTSDKELIRRAYTPYWHKRLGNAHRLLAYLLTDYDCVHAPTPHDIARNIGVQERTARKYLYVLVKGGVVSYRQRMRTREYYVVESVLTELHFADELEART
jgi:predicted ArsR family transcriptional regulator